MAGVVQLITDHMDLWTAAIKRKATAGRGSSSKVELYGIKKLRELILELAVRGLLVPQEPNDEPASELLKKIAEAKAKLVKEGKITKEKPLPPISDDERPFSIPDGWKWSRLQEVSQYIQRGKGPVYAESGLVRVVSQKCIQWQGFDISASRFVDDASLSGYKEERYLRSKDLLWNSTGTGTVGRVIALGQIPEQSIVADSHVTIVRLLDADADYFRIYISSPSVQSRIDPTHGDSIVSGSTQQVELNTSAVTLLPVPVPPLGEQNRIVAKVNELMALCDQLEQRSNASLRAHQALVETLLIALTEAADHAQFTASWNHIAAHFDTLFTTEESIDQFKLTTLQLAVMGKLVVQVPNDEPAGELLKRIATEKSKLVKEGKIRTDKSLPPASKVENRPFELPSNWEWAALGDCCSKITDGEHVTPDRSLSGNYLLSARNVTNDGILLNDVDYVPDDEFARIRKRCDPNIGDVLISCSGSIGRVALVDRDNSYAMVRSAAMVRPVFICPGYLALCLRAPVLQAQMVAKSRQSAQANLFLGAISSLVVALPPIQEQYRIVAKVNELMTLCDELKTHLNESQTTQLHLADTLAEQALGTA